MDQQRTRYDILMGVVLHQSEFAPPSATQASAMLEGIRMGLALAQADSAEARAIAAELDLVDSIRMSPDGDDADLRDLVQTAEADWKSWAEGVLTETRATIQGGG